MFNCKQNSSYLMSYTMWSKHFIQLHIAFAIFTSLLCITQSTSHVAIKLCENNSTEKEEIALTCSCLSMNEVSIKLHKTDYALYLSESVEVQRLYTVGPYCT